MLTFTEVETALGDWMIEDSPYEFLLASVSFSPLLVNQELAICLCNRAAARMALFRRSTQKHLLSSSIPTTRCLQVYQCLSYMTETFDSMIASIKEDFDAFAYDLRNSLLDFQLAFAEAQKSKKGRSSFMYQSLFKSP